MKIIKKLLLVSCLFIIPTIACQTFSLPIQQGQVYTPTSKSPSVIHEETIIQSSPSPDPSLLPDLVPLEDTLVALYDKVNLGVVAIRVLTEDGSGLGSGFVIDHHGHIITNYHVIEGITDLEVDFPSGNKTRGEIVGTDKDSDLAVIKVNLPAEALFPLTLGNSSTIHVGQTVIAIGNPFGLNGTMTVGIISASGRTLQSLHEAPEGGLFTAGDIIQTDAAINPGNSGGPLLNLNGEVIGINRAIRTLNFTTTEEPINSGVGFAIAINIVKRVIPDLISKGYYDYPYLGISSLDDISLIEQEALSLPRATGAYITSINPDSPAEKAGLISGTRSTSIPFLKSGGDLIISVDQQPVIVFGDLLSYLLNNKGPGDIVTLTVLREGKELQVDLTLGKRP
jgi:S1-C subfamily serine protease